MTINQLRARAERLGTIPRRAKKIDLIRFIQLAEGNPPCFARVRSGCGEEGCCWRQMCRRQAVGQG